MSYNFDKPYDPYDTETTVFLPGVRPGVKPSTRKKLTGRRKSKKKGMWVEASLPVESLSNYAIFGKNNQAVIPVAEWPERNIFPIKRGSRGSKGEKEDLVTLISNGTIDRGMDDGETTFTFGVENGMVLEREFSRIIPGETRVIALANSENAEHALLLFINGHKVWSVGYGFSGSADEEDETFSDNLQNLLSEKTSLGSKEKEAITHAFETMQGTLYTTDHLLSTWTQEAHIIWVGFLSEEMRGRINDFLKHVNKVELKSEGDYDTTKKVIMTNNMALEVKDSWYGELASWLGRGNKGRKKLNCLEWVKHILGENLMCGYLGKPSHCKRISDEEWNDLTTGGYFNTDLSEQQLGDILLRTQTRLLASDFESTVGNTTRTITNNPMLAGACIGAACFASAGVLGVSLATTLGVPLSFVPGTATCIASGTACGAAAPTVGREILKHHLTPKPPSMKRGGIKTKRKNQKRKTHGKIHKRHGKQTKKTLKKIHLQSQRKKQRGKSRR